MSRQGKTRRRLFLLLSGTLAITALAGSGALLRMHYIRQRAFQGRTDGLAAIEHKDYAKALNSLGLYLSRYPDDGDVLLPYAVARENVEEPNGRHLGQAIALFQRVLELKPGLPEAQNNLLDLYSRVGYNTEAITLADAMLPKNPADLGKSPADAHILDIKALADIRMHRLDQAAAVAQKLTAIAPLNLDFHLLEIQIMLNRGQQNSVEPYAAALAKAHPGDVRFILLQSMAASLVGDHQPAEDLAVSLVTRPSPDSAYIRMLVRQLDALGHFGEVFTLLQHAAKGNADPETTHLWISRLFETNHLELLLQETAALDPAAAPVETLGMRILAFSHLNRSAEAAKALAALDQRGHSDVAAARWAGALRALTQSTASDPIATIGLLRDALTASPDDFILVQELGNAYAAANAADNAVAAWRRAAALAPAWSAPLVRLSQAYAGESPANALIEAKAAVLRAPDDRDALKNLVAISSINLPAELSDEGRALLAQITGLQQKFPGDDDLATFKAAVYARMQQPQDAIKIIQSILKSPHPPEHTLLSLAALSDMYKLDQEEACFDAAAKAYGVTPNLAQARARWLFHHQHGPEGLTLLDKAKAAHPNDVAWQTIWAEYLDLVNDPRAKNAWTVLGDGNAKTIKIQWQALNARAVQADHDFIGRTINRISELLGNDNLTLQLVRARWLLQSPSDEDVTRAGILLSDITRADPQVLQAHLLLASFYLRPKNHNVNGAIDELVNASDIQLENADIALQLAGLLNGRGDFSRARQYIERAMRSKTATAQNRRQAAELLAGQGEYADALALLDKTGSSPRQPPDILLAMLYRQAGDFKKTDDICRKLLEKPDAAGIAFCADFYASQDRPKDAQNTLNLLGHLKLQPGVAELLLATFAAQHATMDEAVKQFRLAVNAAPKEALIWRQFVSLYLRAGKIDEAVAIANEASQKLPDPAAFKALRDNAALVKNAARVPAARELIMSLAISSTENGPAVDALKLIAPDPRQEGKKVSLRQTAAKLRELANSNPRNLALQMVTVQCYLNADQMEEATTLATQTAETFPAAVEALRLATDVLSRARQWDQALLIARKWRRIDSGNAIDADLAIAGAELQLHDSAAASRQIEPYLDRARREPDQFSGILILHAQCLLAAGQPGQVESLLGPLLSKAPIWRNVWRSFAVLDLTDSARARAWLDKLDPLTTDKPNERTDLARGWMDLGKRYSNAGFVQKGHDILAGIVQAPGATAYAWLAWGRVCEASSDWKGAEHAARQAVRLQPDEPVALNNLAFDILKSKGDLAEAQQLIAQALKLSPDEPAFLDTKAAIQDAQKDYTSAVATLKTAQVLDPRNIEWKINMIAVLVDAGQTSAARSEMDQITAAVPAANNLSPAARERYESLRKNLQTTPQ